MGQGRQKAHRLGVGKGGSGAGGRQGHRKLGEGGKTGTAMVAGTRHKGTR